jgi:hypothetical protein
MLLLFFIGMFIPVVHSWILLSPSPFKKGRVFWLFNEQYFFQEQVPNGIFWFYF